MARLDGSDGDPLAVADIAVGTMHACARFNDGSVKCWGARTYGQLGNEDTLGKTQTTVPSVIGDIPLLP